MPPLRVFVDKLFFGTDDYRQRLRLRRFFMAQASYLMWFAIASVALAADRVQVSSRQLWVIGLLLVMTQSAVYIALRSGWNKRFADPSLTFLQIILALAWTLVLMALARDARGFMLPVYMVSLLFGVFALGRRDFIVLSILAFAGYGGLVGYELSSGPDVYSLRVQLISLIVLALLLLWTALFGAYVSRLRERLSTSNRGLRRALERNRELAEHDDLTGLYNRRYVMEALNKLKARADRCNEPFAICIIDLDRFKEVNDRFGHSAGDEALINFGRLAGETLRGMDLMGITDEATFGRYGGEEFMLLLPITDAYGAYRCMERLRMAAATARAGDGAAPGVTLSAGIAEYRPEESVEALLRRADRALYRAKSLGRNRVELAADQ